MSDSATVSHDSANKFVWVVTFIDLVTLLLTFFVLIFAMSVPDGGRYADVAIGLGKTFGGERKPGDVEAGADTYVLNEIKRAGLDLDYVGNLIEGHMVADDILRRARVHRLLDRLVISLPGDVVFASNSAELSATAPQAIGHLAALLSNLNNQIAIQGHTDPNPIRGGQFTSNWELSLARASAVAMAVKNAGYERPLTVLGLGESRYADLDTNIPPNRRYQLARRVDIVIASAR